MKNLILLFLLFSFSAFAYDPVDYHFEREEIRKHREAGRTVDRGGYWAAPVPDYSADRKEREYREELDRMIQNDSDRIDDMLYGR